MQRPNSDAPLDYRDRLGYQNLPRHPLIVCASLVSHPGNLGAFCRTVEAFRLESLVMADAADSDKREFRGLAASAHHWQPTTICPPHQLTQWLQRQRGYSVLALQPRREAIPLTQFRFPKQAVLGLGRELTGIPAEILVHCDHTLAIPQFGMVESLNVQTAAAIAIYEYIRQHPII